MIISFWKLDRERFADKRKTISFLRSDVLSDVNELAAEAAGTSPVALGPRKRTRSGRKKCGSAWQIGASALPLARSRD
jgi:hypothetical protein